MARPKSGPCPPTNASFTKQHTTYQEKHTSSHLVVATTDYPGNNTCSVDCDGMQKQMTHLA